jgi:hypothetical protein
MLIAEAFQYQYILYDEPCLVKDETERHTAATVNSALFRKRTKCCHTVRQQALQPQAQGVKQIHSSMQCVYIM